jgi:hypothetical protein
MRALIDPPEVDASTVPIASSMRILPPEVCARTSP